MPALCRHNKTTYYAQSNASILCLSLAIHCLIQAALSQLTFIAAVHSLKQPPFYSLHVAAGLAVSVMETILTLSSLPEQLSTHLTPITAIHPPKQQPCTHLGSLFSAPFYSNHPPIPAVSSQLTPKSAVHSSEHLPLCSLLRQPSTHPRSLLFAHFHISHPLI